MKADIMYYMSDELYYCLRLSKSGYSLYHVSNGHFESVFATRSKFWRKICLELGSAIKKAGQLLFDYEYASVSLSVILHGTVPRVRVQVSISKTQSDREDRHGAYSSPDSLGSIYAVLMTAIHEIDAYGDGKSFGTGTVVIERVGDSIKHIETIFDERILLTEDAHRGDSARRPSRTFRVVRRNA